MQSLRAMPDTGIDFADDPLPMPTRAALDAERWRALASQIGSDVATPLSAALERVNALASTGKIDRQGLRALRSEIEAARRVGLMGQQLIRVASGRIRLQPERVQLTQTLRETLLQRGREATGRAIEMAQSLGPAEVIVDATLLYALLQALIDWMFERAKTLIEFKLDHDRASGQARLACRFRLPSTPDPAMPSDPDTMSWRLAAQIAETLSLPLERRLAPGEGSVVLAFTRTVSEPVQGVATMEFDAGFPLTVNSKPLAGMHVLVIASRRDVRSTTRDALRHMGLVLDFVPSVEDAEQFCSSALPHAIVFESLLAGRRLDQLRDTILRETPRLAFIEIGEEGRSIQFAAQGAADGHTRVARDAIVESLPSALFFELSSL